MSSCRWRRSARSSLAWKLIIPLLFQTQAAAFVAKSHLFQVALERAAAHACAPVFTPATQHGTRGTAFIIGQLAQFPLLLTRQFRWPSAMPAFIQSRKTQPAPALPPVFDGIDMHLEFVGHLLHGYAVPPDAHSGNTHPMRQRTEMM